MATTITLPTTHDWYGAIVDHWCAQHAAATDEQDTGADTTLIMWVSYDEDAEGSPFTLRFDESMENMSDIAWAQLDLADDPYSASAVNDAWGFAHLFVTSCYRWAKARGLVA